jgi:hypothetical protein
MNRTNEDPRDADGNPLCAWCGKGPLPPSRGTKPRAYCSQACVHRAYRARKAEQARERLVAAYMKGRVVWPCWCWAFVWHYGFALARFTRAMGCEPVRSPGRFAALFQLARPPAAAASPGGAVPRSGTRPDVHGVDRLERPHR